MLVVLVNAHVVGAPEPPDPGAEVLLETVTSRTQLKRRPALRCSCCTSSA